MNSWYIYPLGHVSLSSSMNFTLISDSQFTLTSVSTGGPVTTVTWSRQYNYHFYTVTERTETVLDDPVTAQYTHTLTVSGRLEGLYTCAVANEASNDSVQFSVQSKTGYDH